MFAKREFRCSAWVPTAPVMEEVDVMWLTEPPICGRGKGIHSPKGIHAAQTEKDQCQVWPSGSYRTRERESTSTGDDSEYFYGPGPLCRLVLQVKIEKETLFLAYICARSQICILHFNFGDNSAYSLVWAGPF